MSKRKYVPVEYIKLFSGFFETTTIRLVNPPSYLTIRNSNKSQTKYKSISKQIRDYRRRRC